MPEEALAHGRPQPQSRRTGEPTSWWRDWRLVLGRLTTAKGSGFVVLQTMLTQALVIGINLLTGVLTARMLGPEGRGVFAAATLWPQLLLATSFLGMPSAIVYFTRMHRQAAGSIFAASIIIAAAYFCLTTVVGLIAAPLTMRHYSADAVLLAQVCAVMTGFYVLQMLLRQLFVGLGLFASFNLTVCLPPALYLGGLLIALALGKLTVVSATLCLMGSMAVTAVWMFCRVNLVCRPVTRGLSGWFRPILSYATRGAAADFLAGVASFSDRLILIAFISPVELGLYAVAYSCSRMMFILQTVVNSVVFPAMAGRSKSDIKALHDHAFRFTLYAAATVVALVILAGKSALVLLYGSSFLPAVVILNILVVEAGLTCVAAVTEKLYCSLDAPGFVSVAQSVSFIVIVAGLAVLVPVHGAVGAASAVLLATVVRLIVLLGGLPILLKLSLPRVLPHRSDFSFLRRLFAAPAI